ncbi:MAG: ArsR/SmtB family transcription factor [Pseudomonadota bacterium]
MDAHAHIVAALAALAQDTRLAIYRLLVAAGPDGLVVGRIGEALDVPATTLSFHLRTLAQAGLIVARPDGRFIHYAANFDAMRGLIAYLTENCCDGDPARCGIAVAAPRAIKRRASR